MIHFLMTKRSTSSPSAVICRTGERPAVDVDDGQRVHLGDVLERELLPRGRVVLLLGVVEMLAACAGDEVDHAFGRRVGLAVERLVERELAVDVPSPWLSSVLVSDRRRVVLRCRNEPQRVGPLVVVDVSVEDDVDLAGLEDGSEDPHVLLVEVALRRVEAGLMEADEPPGRSLGGGQVVVDPLLELAVGPVDRGVGVEDRPVRLP